MQKDATVAVNATISFTWTGCKAAVRGPNVPSFTFPGSNDGLPFKLDNFEKLFFVNLECPVDPAPTAAPSADKANACVRTLTDIMPEGIISNTADSTTGISFYEGNKYGYKAQATLAACAPGTSTDVLTATKVTFNQECYNIASATPNTVKTELVRQNTTDATSESTEVIFSAPLYELFTDATCMESIASVTTSNSVCTVEVATYV